MAELSQVLKQATGVVAARGEGVLLYDEDDRRYLDFTAGIGVTSTGHCHPRVVEAAQRQVGDADPRAVHDRAAPPAARPGRPTRRGPPPDLDRMFFANSGSEAIEAALRLSRQATGRPNVIVFHGGFHGRTVAAASMTTSGTKFRSGLQPADGRRARLAVPRPDALRLAGRAGDGLRAQPTRLRPADLERAGRHRGVLRRAGARRGRLRARRTSGSSPDCASAPTDTASCWWSTRCRPGSAGPGKFWGGDHFDAPAGHPGHREGAGLRLPAVRRSPHRRR